MKTGIHTQYYAAGGSYDLEERLSFYYLYRTKHGRVSKDKNLSKRARYLVKRGSLDGVDLINFNPDNYDD